MDEIEVYTNNIICQGTRSVILEAVNLMLIDYETSADQLIKNNIYLSGIGLKLFRNETSENALFPCFNGKNIELNPGMCAIEWIAVPI